MTTLIDIPSTVTPLRWKGDAPSGVLQMLDQRQLPHQETWLELRNARDVADAIRDMVIRGAPAIGIAAAYGFALGVRNYAADPMANPEREFDRLVDQLTDTRPTAVNLQWALQRCRHIAADFEGSLDELTHRLFEEAAAIHDEDCRQNRRLATHGFELFNTCPVRLMTHCNTGGLATGGIGTALGVARGLHARGALETLWVNETRPYLQGTRLTTWECQQDDLPHTLICDSAAASIMARGDVDAVVVGTDRVAANGDVANKIGTLSLATLCHHHDIPFYVASPLSTIDLDTPTGDDIPIEERSPDEVTHFDGHPVAPDDTPVHNPAFDVTPNALVDAIITEAGVATAPYTSSLAALKTS